MGIFLAVALALAACIPLMDVYANSYSPMVIDEIAIESINGMPLTTLTEGRQDMLTVIVRSNINEDQPILPIIEIRDDQAFTVAIMWQSGIAKANGLIEMKLSWLPEKGCYELRAFVLSGIVNPAALSIIDTRQVTVLSASRKDPISGEFQLVQKGPVSFFMPDQNSTTGEVYIPSNYTLNFDISGTFELSRGCDMELLAKSATVTVRQDGKTVSTETYGPLSTYGSSPNYQQLNFRVIGTSGGDIVGGHTYFEYPPLSADFERTSTIKITGGYIRSPEFEVSEPTGYLRLVPSIE